jgi:hypothetical protein
MEASSAQSFIGEDGIKTSPGIRRVKVVPGIGFKNGEIVPTSDNIEGGVTSAAAQHGVKWHKIFADRLRGKTIAQIAAMVDEVYAGVPTVVQEWLHSAIGALATFDAIVQPPPGFISEDFPEVRFQTMATVGVTSAENISDNLETEQTVGGGIPGPLEHLIRIAPHLLEPYADKDAYEEALANLPDDFPYTAEEIDQHLKNMYPYRYVERISLVHTPGCRPDQISLRCKEGKPKARNAISAFGQVLKAGIGYDAEKLVGLKVEYTHYDEKTGEPSVREIPAMKAIHQAFKLIVSGDIKPELIDTKTISHVEDDARSLNEIFDKNDNDLAKVFHDDNVYSQGDEHKVERKRWRSYEYDAAVTFSAMANCCGFWLKVMDDKRVRGNPDVRRYKKLDFEKFVNAWDVSILIVNADISDPMTIPQQTNGKRLINKDGNEYELDPPIHKLGVAQNPTMLKKPVHQERINYFFNIWELRVRISKELGRIAAAAAKVAIPMPQQPTAATEEESHDTPQEVSDRKPEYANA